MRRVTQLFILFFVSGFSYWIITALQLSDEEKMMKFLNADELIVKKISPSVNVGERIEQIHIKRSDFYVQFIHDEGTDFQYYTLYVPTKGIDSLTLFIERAFHTHDPNRLILADCNGGSNYSKFSVRSGFSELTLKPDSETHKLFNELLKNRCYISLP